METALSGWLEQLAQMDYATIQKECVYLMAALDEGLIQQNEIIVIEEEKIHYWSSWVRKHKTWDALRLHIRKFVLDGVRALKQVENPSSTGWFEQAVQIVNRSRDPNLSLETVAEEVGVHPVTLSRIFKQQTGMNFVKYLVRLRLRHAQTLLLTTDKKINQISEEIGYADYRYFRNLFKKEFGMTPSEYRKKNGIFTASDESET